MSEVKNLLNGTYTKLDSRKKIMSKFEDNRNDIYSDLQNKKKNSGINEGQKRYLSE